MESAALQFPWRQLGELLVAEALLTEDQRRMPLFESANFLETADYAFEFVEEHDPAALEIHRTHGAAQETVWNYSASRAAAVHADCKELVETFGFDPTAWGKK